VTGKRQVEAVLFDYGGVLTTPVRNAIAAWLERDRIDPASFSRALKRWLSRSAPPGTPIHRLELGELSGPEFNLLLGAELTDMDGGAVSPADLLQRLFAETRPDEEMLALVHDVRDTGVQVALLSNSWGNDYPREQLDALFGQIVISAEVGMRKPNADIFEHALGLLQLEAHRVVFIDDADANTNAAAALHLRTILHRDASATREALVELIPALTSGPTPGS
jgi:putative hydrolase of the HAD superfamily